MASLRIIWIIWMSDHSAVLCGATFIGHKVHGCDPDRMPHTRTNIGNSETKAIDATTKSSSADSKVNGGAVDRRTERERERERKATKNEPSIAHRKTREEKKIQDGRPTKAKRERERERERENQAASFKVRRCLEHHQMIASLLHCTSRTPREAKSFELAATTDVRRIFFDSFTVES